MHSGSDDDPILKLLDQGALASVTQEGLPGVPSMPASNEGLEAQFFGEVHKYFRRRLAAPQGQKPAMKPCAIVLSRAILQDLKKFGAERLHYFEGDDELDIDGAIMIANHDLSIVGRIPVEACKGLQALGSTIIDVGLKDEVHCILKGASGDMMLCSSGLDAGKMVLQVSKSAAVRLSPKDVEQKVWNFHEKFVQTPSGYLLPWKGKTSDRVTVDNAELRISMMLGFFLTTVVGEDNVSVEDHLPRGRADVKVSAHGMAPGLGACAMECKVLRSRAPAGGKYRSVPEADMIDHACEGVQQACDYRKDVNGKLAYLFCFDARLVDEDQPAVEAMATKNDVTLRRYYMYSSTKDYRNAVKAAKGAGKLLSGQPA